MIRDVTTDDVAAICEIYNHYITNTVVTFEEIPVTTEQMQTRIASVTESYPWIVFIDNEQVSGYAYVGKFHQRTAYRHTLECTIYLHPEAAGRGIGKKLFAELLERVQQLPTPIHSVIGCIALPNEPSVALHEKFGFKKVGHLTEAGYKMDRWIDVGYWQLLLA